MGQPAIIDVYFTCLGVLSAHGHAPKAENPAYVSKWLLWYAKHQAKDGTISRFDGKRDRGGLLANGAKSLTPDSHDSYAATHIALAEAHRKASGRAPDPKVVVACQKCFDVLLRCPDANGLHLNFDPAATPAGVIPGHYLLDNIEVHQGWVAAQELFAAANDDARATQARVLAKELSGNLKEFWSPEQRFFVCRFADRAAGKRWEEMAVAIGGLATVSALAFFDDLPEPTKSVLWMRLFVIHGKELEKGFMSVEFGKEEPVIERAFLAAIKAAPPADRVARLETLRKRADELIARQRQLSDARAQGLPFPYVHRHGMLIQALLAQDGDPVAELPTIRLGLADVAKE